jgi:hypothetical protein
MLSRNATLFLIIACSYWFSVLVFLEIRYYLISSHYFRESFSDFASLGIMLSFPIALLLTGIGMGQNREQLRKTGAVLLAVVAASWICSDVYYQYMYFHRQPTELREEEFNLVRHIVQHWLIYVPTLAFLLAGILLAGNNRRNHRKAAVWLIAGAIPYLFSLFFSNVENIVFNYLMGERYGQLEQTEWIKNLEHILRLLMVAFPLAILVAGISLLKNLPMQKAASEEEMVESIDTQYVPETRETPVPAVIDWLRWYLLAAIPFAGIILLGMWAVDRRKPIRSNWSMALFLARFLTSTLTSLLVVPYFLLELFEDLAPVYFVTTLVFHLLFLVAAGVLLFVHHQRKEREQQDDSHPTLLTWIGNFLILAIPLIGIICLIIWATDDRNHIVKKWALARLIWAGIMFVYTVYAYHCALEILRISEEFIYFQF